MTYQLNLNVGGNDYLITVEDIETVNLLLNDADAAIKYLTTNYAHLLPGTSNNNNSNVNLNNSSTNEDDFELLDPNSISGASTSSKNDKNPEISTSKRPTDKDKEATTILLQLREQMDSEFKDKKSSKSKLWQKIADCLKQKGFSLGENATEKCRQKFSNLAKSYINYIKTQKTTGEGAIDPPPFFDELHSILGSKHKVNPEHLEDSFSVNATNGNAEETVGNDEVRNVSPDETVTSDVEDSSNSNERKNIKSRFLQSRKKVKPKTKTDYILEAVREGNEERKEQFIIFLNI